MALPSIAQIIDWRLIKLKKGLFRCIKRGNIVVNIKYIYYKTITNILRSFVYKLNEQIKRYLISKANCQQTQLIISVTIVIHLLSKHGHTAHFSWQIVCKMFTYRRIYILNLTGNKNITEYFRLVSSSSMKIKR